MIIGIPREIKEQEHRVALMPSGAYQLAKHHQVLVETEEKEKGVSPAY